MKNTRNILLAALAATAVLAAVVFGVAFQSQTLAFFDQFPASSYYHAIAFLATAFLSQYSVQIVKLISKNSLGKNSLRFLNGAFSTLFVAAGALATGGISIGSLTISAAAISTFSAVIYRIHQNSLYKTLQKAVDEELAQPEPVPTFAG